MESFLSIFFKKAIQARLEYLKTHMVKTDQGHEDEEKMIEDDHSIELQQQQQQQLVLQQQQQQQQAKQDTTGAKQVKTAKLATTVDEAKTKGGKQKKSVIETKTLEQPVEQLVEPVNPVDEVLLNRPPTPPKPKTVLPPVDIIPFVRYKETFKFSKY
jgi:hypothetical protein